MSNLPTWSQEMAEAASQFENVPYGISMPERPSWLYNNEFGRKTQVTLPRINIRELGAPYETD